MKTIVILMSIAMVMASIGMVVAAIPDKNGTLLISMTTQEYVDYYGMLYLEGDRTQRTTETLRVFEERYGMLPTMDIYAIENEVLPATVNEEISQVAEIEPTPEVMKVTPEVMETIPEAVPEAIQETVPKSTPETTGPMTASRILLILVVGFLAILYLTLRKKD